MLHGIENISYNSQGYIFWKDQQIEHFDHPTDSKMAESTKELERRCKLLEKRGAVINCGTVIWEWDESGNGDRWEIAFDDCKATRQARNAAKRICVAYGIKGICDPAYIANVIQTEMSL